MEIPSSTDITADGIDRHQDLSTYTPPAKKGKNPACMNDTDDEGGEPAVKNPLFYKDTDDERDSDEEDRREPQLWRADSRAESVNPTGRQEQSASACSRSVLYVTG